MSSSDPAESASGRVELLLRLHAIRWEAEDIVGLELRDPSGRPLPAWDVGAHVDLSLPNGVTRSYSLVNLPDDDRRYEIAVALDRQSRGGSRFIHEALRPGHLIKVAPPRNNFPLRDDGKPAVLIAGGIGVTPILAMARSLAGSGRPFRFVYAARTRAHAAFLTGAQAFGPAASFHFDDEAGGAPLDIARVVAQAPDDAHFYCCGPAGMLDAFERATGHIAPERVHLERFSAAARPESEVSASLKVELARSGRVFDIPADKPILDVLLDAGLDLPFSCQEGVCGSCETRVIEGIPDHRDSVLSPAEKAGNRTMMICVSRCKGDYLKLDL